MNALKTFFVLLLVANIGLFAYRFFHETPPPEPQQTYVVSPLQADKIRVVEGNVSSLIDNKGADKKGSACFELGVFAAEDIREIETALMESKSVGKDFLRRIRQKSSAHIVYLPSPGGQARAEQRVQELKRMGINNYYIIQEPGPKQWAVSLGIFRSLNLAQELVASLKRLGINDAQIDVRGPAENGISYIFGDVSDKEEKALRQIMSKFPNQRMSKCNG